MKNFVINPFFYYSLSFILVFFLYTLGWSDLYLPLSGDLSLFIGFTIVFSIFMVFLFNKIIKNSSRVKIKPVEKKKVIYLFIFLCFSLLAEFIYHGLVPLLLVIRGVYYDYTQFGIPVFHVFLVSYTTLLGVVYFYRYLVYKEKYYLLIFFFSLFFSISIVNRGTLMFILLAVIISYASLNLNILKIFKILITIFLVIFAFGILGNLRMISSGYKDQDAILKIGQASENFTKTNLPTEFFWAYLYISSPYANLENEVKKRAINDQNNISGFLNYEILPDFISKRLNFINNKSNLLVDELNVSTMYAGSINKMGFIGAFLLYFWYVLAILITPFLINREYFIPTVILLSTLSSFLMFDNVLKFSGFVFQFFILILFSRFKFKQISIL